MPHLTPVFFHTAIGPIPAWLPTTLLVTDVREWIAKVTPAGLNLPKKIKGGTLKYSLYGILLRAGIAFTQGVGLQLPSPSALAPLYRYIDLFAGTAPKLRLIGPLNKVDPRFRQVIGEEIAIGITWLVLNDYLDVVHIADLEPLMRPQLNKPAMVEFVPNHKDERRPDFFCEDSAGAAVIAESKGAVGPPSKLTGPKGPISKGKAQVANVQPTSHKLNQNVGRVVIGTNIQMELPNLRSESTTHISDPPGPNAEDIPDISDFNLRVAYAKILRYVGHHTLAELLLATVPWPLPEEPYTLTWGGARLVPVGLAPIGGLVTIERGVFKALTENDSPDLRGRLRSRIAEFQAIMSRGMESGNLPAVDILPNGTVVLFEWDSGTPLFRGVWWPPVSLLGAPVLAEPQQGRDDRITPRDTAPDNGLTKQS